MKIKKLILPIVVLFGAIAMAFNTIDLKEIPTQEPQDFIELGGVRQPIPEQDCVGTTYTCRIKFQEEGPEYVVYDHMNDAQPKRSSSKEATLITQ